MKKIDSTIKQQGLPVVIGLLFLVLFLFMTTMMRTMTAELREEVVDLRERNSNIIVNRDELSKKIKEYENTYGPREHEKTFRSYDGEIVRELIITYGGRVISIVNKDRKTEKEVAQEDVKDFAALLSRFEGFSSSSVFLKKEQEKYYAVLVGDIGYAGKQILVASSGSNGSDMQVKSVKFQQVNNGSIGIKILDYYPKTGQIVASEGWGDGCGSKGNIIVYQSNGTKDNIQEFGSGCTYKDINTKILYPEFVGYRNGLAYFIDKEIENGTWEDAEAKSLYSIDPLTLKKKNISYEFDDDMVMGAKWDEDRIEQANELYFNDWKTHDIMVLNLETLETNRVDKEDLSSVEGE